MHVTQCVAILLLSAVMVMAEEEPSAGGDPSEAPGESSTESPDQTPTEAPGVNLNLNVPMKTLGGRQFWADVACFHDWRIQQNVFTKHFRLLDGADVRHAWGTLDQCRTRLDGVRREQKLADMSGEVVVLVHGICRSSKSMDSLKKHLRKEGFQTFSFDYPSTRVSIEQSADSLNLVLESMPGVEKVHLIGFSLGGLVVRSCLHRHPQSRLGRVMLIGTPNRGAELADTFRGNFLYQFVFGPAGQQLASSPEGAGAMLPAPPGEFAVIAGVRNTDGGYNPLITGDDDGTVGLTSARLNGACDFLAVPSLHTFLVGHPDTLEAATLFLRTGRLREKGEAQPIHE